MKDILDKNNGRPTDTLNTIGEGCANTGSRIIELEHDIIVLPGVPPDVVGQEWALSSEH